MKLRNPAVELWRYLRCLHSDAEIDHDAFMRVASDLEQPVVRLTPEQRNAALDDRSTIESNDSTV